MGKLEHIKVPAQSMPLGAVQHLALAEAMGLHRDRVENATRRVARLRIELEQAERELLIARESHDTFKNAVAS